MALKVSKNKDSLGYGDEFRMIENNNHPFLHNVKKRFALICIGNQEFPTSGKDIGEIIARRLFRCREVLMYGYTANNYAESYQLRNNRYFGQNKREEKKLEREGIPIIKGGPRK